MNKVWCNAAPNVTNGTKITLINSSKPNGEREVVKMILKFDFDEKAQNVIKLAEPDEWQKHNFLCDTAVVAVVVYHHWW